MVQEILVCGHPRLPSHPYVAGCIRLLLSSIYSLQQPPTRREKEAQTSQKAEETGLRLPDRRSPHPYGSNIHIDRWMSLYNDRIRSNETAYFDMRPKAIYMVHYYGTLSNLSQIGVQVLRKFRIY